MSYFKRMSTEAKLALAASIIVIIVVASLVGYWYVLRPVTLPLRANVGLIEIYGEIYEEARDRIVKMVDYALRNETIKAVVLRVDSPGGSADAIEEVYLSLLKLRAQKPVVASIVGYGASGGYYIAIASNLTYTTSGSLVGNVGVIGRLPDRLFPSERYVETGPYKVTGFSEKEFAFKLQMVLESFLDAVMAERGDRLRLNRTELSKGLVYFGMEAVQNGLVDGIGSTIEAIEKSAELAGIKEYGVVRVSEMVEERPVTGTLNASSIRTEEDLDFLQPPPAFHYIYLPTLSPKPKTNGVGGSSTNSSRNASSSADERKIILIDNSHENAFYGEELTILLSEIASMNYTARYFEAGEDLEERLNQTISFVVLSPRVHFSDSEIDSVWKFVENGGRLLMILDPTRALSDPINSLAVEFGVVFGNGFLYNLEEHYGNYRNLIISDFEESNVTRGLNTIVFYTASHIYSNDQVAFTSDRTFSSEGELAKKFSPIAFLSERGVLAIGDQTFLTEPYCYLEDNYKLILNLVSVIAGVEVAPAPPAPPTPEEKITRPDLPVGTEKNFTERVNGEEHLLRWFKVSELEVRVERPDRTTHYYYDEEGSLLRWVSNGMEAVYEPPIPEEPYPLTKGKSWEYESSYTLIMEGEEYSGRLVGEEEVVGFEDVMAEDGESYLCAKVRYRRVDQLMKDGTNITIVTTGHSWISTEAGLVKEESTSRYYVDGVFVDEEKRELLLKSIKKG